VLASLVGFLGDFDRAEEAVQEAFAIAAERWPRDGAPDNPGAWLVTTARNRAIDRLRRERTLASKTRLLEVRETVQETALYGELGRITRSPVVELNRAVAVAETGSPQAALDIVERLGLEDYQYLHSTRAELLRRLGRTDEARTAYKRAIQLTRAGPERQFLRRRLGEL
jgi:predicted RNA polymerase sigma factor